MLVLLPAIAALLLGISLAGSAVILSNADMAGTWNVMLAYATGVGYGQETLVAGTPFGSLASGGDTIVFLAGTTDTNGTASFHNFFQSYFVHRSGLFTADSNAAALTASLADTAPSVRVVGSLADTGPAAVFFGLRLLRFGTDDLFVGVRANTLATGELLGASGVDTFIGAALTRGRTDSFVAATVFALSRPADTAVAIRSFRPGDSLARAAIGCSVSLVSGGGTLLLNPRIGLTQSIAGSSGHFSETNAVFRAIFTADTNLAVIVRDTAPTESDALHAQTIAFAIRRRSPLALADLAGAWQAAALIPESAAFNAVLGFFEFRSDGTGVFDNGAPPPLHFARACTAVLAGDSLGGATRGDSFYLLTLRPARDSADVQLRMYLSVDTRFITMSGFRGADRMIGLGARRSNSIRRRFAFNTPDTPVSEGSLSIGLRVDSGASPAAPTFIFSTLDTASARVQAYRDLRDTALRNLKVDTIHGAVTIISDTTVRLDSVIITIDIRGSADSSGAKNLIPMVFEVDSNAWVRIPEESVTARDIGIVSFHPPHFSDFAAGEADATPGPDQNADFAYPCIIASALDAARASFFLPALRSIRDRMLDATLGRILVALYGASGWFLAFAGAGLLLARRGR